MTDRDFEARHLETLDRDLGRMTTFEQATAFVGRPLIGKGIAFLFLLAAALFATIAFSDADNPVLIILAATFGAYGPEYRRERCRQQHGPGCRSECRDLGWRNRDCGHL